MSGKPSSYFAQPSKRRKSFNYLSRRSLAAPLVLIVLLTNVFMHGTMAFAQSGMSDAGELAENILADLGEESVERIANFKALSDPENIAQSQRKILQLLDVAQSFSPLLRETEFTAAAAGRDIDAAKGARLPQVTLTGQSNYSGGDLASASRATGKPSVSIAAQYPLYDWGRISANIRGREQAQLSALERKTLVSRQVSVEATSICLELNKQRAITQANVEYLQKLQDLANRIGKIVAEDKGRASELLQVRSRFLQGESQAEQIRSRVKEIGLRLERLLGANQQSLCRDIGASLMRIPSESQILDGIAVHPQIQLLTADYEQAKANTEQISAVRKPQVNLRAEHAPMAAGITNDYAQALTIAATVPIYDGNTLKSSERAAIERSNAALERIDAARNQLRSDLLERAKQAAANFKRAADYVNLLEVNEKVRADFYLQWAALGRRSLFELLAIQQEQLILRSGYFTTLYDGMIATALIRGTLGKLTEQEN